MSSRGTQARSCEGGVSLTGQTDSAGALSLGVAPAITFLER